MRGPAALVDVGAVRRRRGCRRPRRPGRRSTSAAIAEAAPLAPSITTRRSVERAPARARRQRGDRGSGRPPAGSVVMRADLRPRWPRPRVGLGSPSAASSASSWASTSSVSLRPPAAKSLMPLSPNGLCEAEIMAAGTASMPARKATAGVGTTPRSTTSTPSVARPAARAAASNGPDRRVSRPISHRDPPSTRAAARPSVSASSGVSSWLATPRTPSVPNFNVRCDPHGKRREPQRRGCGSRQTNARATAWSTAVPCGPS